MFIKTNFCPSSPSSFLHQLQLQPHPSPITNTTVGNHGTPDGSNAKSRLLDLLEQLPKLVVNLPLRTFTCFPKLPLELRNKIWAYYSFTPRTIKLCIATSQHSRAITGGQRIPAVLRTSFESRNEALKHYTLCLQEPAPDSIFLEYGMPKRRRMYVNFEADCFRITNDSSLAARRSFAIGYRTATKPPYRWTYKHGIMSRIRFAEIEMNVTRIGENYENQIRTLWTKLAMGTRLKKLSLVHNFPYWEGNGHIKVDSVSGHLLMRTMEENDAKQMKTSVDGVMSKDRIGARPLDLAVK